MQTQCSSYTDETEAQAEVERLLAAGVPGARISVLSGRMAADHRDGAVGAYAGASGPVGAYAGAPGATADAMGSFAGTGDQRRGSFGDIDRDEVATYEGGVRRVHVASHHELERRLSQAGLDGGAVAALHAGRVLVLIAKA